MTASGGSVVARLLHIFTMALVLPAMASCAGHAAGGRHQAPLAIGVDSGTGTTVFVGAGYHVVKPPGASWFTRADFLRRQEDMKNRARAAGMPEQAVSSSHDAVVKRMMSMDRHMADSLDRYAFARLGIVFDKGAVLNVRAGALTIQLRTAAGDSVTVVDSGILWRTDKDHGHRYFDTQRGVGQFTWDLQKPDYAERSNIFYVRLPRFCDGASVEGVRIDAAKLVVEAK